MFWVAKIFRGASVDGLPLSQFRIFDTEDKANEWVLMKLQAMLDMTGQVEPLELKSYLD